MAWQSNLTGSHIKLRKELDPGVRDVEHTRTGIAFGLWNKESWTAKDVVKYGAVYFDKQGEVASIPASEGSESDDGAMATSVYREALRRMNNWIKESGKAKQRSGSPDGSSVEDVAKPNAPKVVPRDVGMDIARSMSGTFRATPDEAMAARQWEAWHFRADEDDGLMGNGAEAYAGETSPSVMYHNIVLYLLEAIVAKQNGGKVIDLRKLQEDLGEFMSLREAIGNEGPDASTSARVTELSSSLSDYTSYLSTYKSLAGGFDSLAPGEGYSRLVMFF